MSPKKILVVDDSAFMRTIISDLILQDSSFVIVGTANNGIEALDKVKQLDPDAVTLDVEMPLCNGIEALKLISKQCPKPVIMLSSLTEEGGKQTIEALENGAFDFVCKPSPSTGSQDINKVGEMLIERLHEAIKSSYRHDLNQQADLPEIHTSNTILSNKRMTEKNQTPTRKKRADHLGNASPLRKDSCDRRITPVITNEPKGATREPLNKLTIPRKRETEVLNQETLTAKLPSLTHKKREPNKEPVLSKRLTVSSSSSGLNTSSSSSIHQPYSELVAVGTSTGGPRALKELLANLPGTLSAPVFIVQHMPPNFTKSLAERLNMSSELEVKEAEHGELVLAGTAYIAPGGQHMTVKERSDGKLTIELNRNEQRSGHRPSVDVLFESLKSLNKYKRHVVLLTGMGSDGARAMRDLYECGVTSTFAESEESCIVYGMPRAAIDLECVSHVVKLKDMAKEIVKAIE